METHEPPQEEGPIPAAIDPRQFQPPVPRLGGYDPAEVCAAIETISIDGSAPFEQSAYAREDNERFLQTVGMIPAGVEKLLEIGGNPYFISLLIRWFRPEIRAEITNYFGEAERPPEQSILVKHPAGHTESFTLPYKSLNIEAQRFPFEDASFDCVLFCEVIEHMLDDPLASLSEIWRILKPGGTLILTTPNVARLENVARLIMGHNIYDPYSGYGPYGRHNREYNRHELARLVTHAGYDIEGMFTADVHENRAAHYTDRLGDIAKLAAFRGEDLGQYIFVQATKSGAGNPLKPSWLYRSLPDHLLDHTPL